MCLVWFRGDVAMTAQLETIARSAFDAATRSLDAGRAMERHVTAHRGLLVVDRYTIDVASRGDIRVAAFGKAADRMAEALAEQFDRSGVDRAALRGVIVAHTDGVSPISWCERIVGGHPVPTEASFAAGRRLLRLFDGCTERTLAVFLVSGGGSALVEAPRDASVTDDDIVGLNRALLRSDLTIREMNAIRRRVSAIKGGALAAHARPAEQLTLIVSDVSPGEIATVASGPTVADDTTIEELRSAVRRIDGRPGVTPAVMRVLEDSVRTEIPTARDALATGPVVTLLDCRDAAASAAVEVGRVADEVVNLDVVDGPLESVIDAHLTALERAIAVAPGRLVGVVSSGEVTLDVTGDGVGGRNQHSVLYALTRVGALCPSASEIAILSAGTDGRDGPTDAAGAVAGLETLAGAAASGVSIGEYLGRCDSHTFFERCGGLIVTGATGTNVRDIRIVLGRSEPVSSAL